MGLQGLEPCDLVPHMGEAYEVRFIFETNVVSPKNCYELAHNRFYEQKNISGLEMFGGASGTRTLDLPVMSRAL